jgi:methyl-accepting chemotaxis protein
LARQSGLATEEVTRQVWAVQEATEKSVDVLRTIGGQLGALEQAAASIATAVGQQSDASQELARSIDLAARNADDIAAHIGEVRTMAVATGVAAGEVLVSSDELERQSAILRDKAQTFLQTIRGPGEAPAAGHGQVADALSTRPVHGTGQLHYAAIEARA